MEQEKRVVKDRAGIRFIKPTDRRHESRVTGKHARPPGNPIGKRIQSRLDAMGSNRSWLGKQMGVQQHIITRWIGSPKVEAVPAAAAKMLALLLDVDSDYLLCIQKEERKIASYHPSVLSELRNSGILREAAERIQRFAVEMTEVYRELAEVADSQRQAASTRIHQPTPTSLRRDTVPGLTTEVPKRNA